MTTHRIEALTDGIFAIAMTLLVLNLALPELGEITAQTELHNLLFGQTHKFLNYAISFLLLAIFWTRHHRQFHFIKRTDGKHLWINIVFLMFVALMPFSTDLLGDHTDDPMSGVFFGANLLILGCLSLWNWSYATTDHRLVDRSLDPQQVALAKKRGIVIPLVATLAIGLSLIVPQFSSYVYLLIPVLHVIVERLHRGNAGAAT